MNGRIRAGVWGGVVSALCGLFALVLLAGNAAGEEKGNEARWYISPALGWMDFEGDELVKDGLHGTLRLGYDWTDRWTLEGVLAVAPSLDANDKKTTAFDSTHAVGLAVDGLFHFTRWERVDPYLAAGIGLLSLGEHLSGGNSSESMFRGGGGVMYHINDEWAIRADYRGMIKGFGDSPSASSISDVGIMWFWGANVPVKLVATSGTNDSDGDGLTDQEEDELGTNPYDPDTDRDRLTDGQEVKVYRTNPLDPDTDLDMLKDGQEVLDLKTNPLERDTDKGGVADGHEVLEDLTDPLDPKDDLQLFELYIQFDLDKAIIKPEYFRQLNVLAKVLKRNPDATAKIEGHADKTRKSGAFHNRRLSKRRADAVESYLTDKGGIASGRLSSVGYGFDRPKAPNNPVTGNPLNRRVDVYIRNADASLVAEDRREFNESAPAETRETPVKVTKPIPPEDK
jgi:OOP family OmpA-OmpF porin